jgi:hypothetical protein
MGERVTCSLLRGASQLSAQLADYRSKYDRCSLFANDLTQGAGADVR